MTPAQQIVAAPCSRCGHPQTAGALSCGDCGLPLVCGTCGVPYPDPLDDCFCVACGNSIAAAPAPAAAAPNGAAPHEHRRGGGAVAAGRAASVATARQLVERLGRPASDDPDAAFRRDALAAGLGTSTRRALRRWKPGSVALRYLELGAALAREDRLAEAVEAFTRAIAEDERLRGEALRDIVDAAIAARDADLAVRKGLELALAEPARASAVVRQADGLLNADVAAAHGDWILRTFYPQIAEQDTDAAVYGALFAARVAIMCGDDDAAVELCERAAGRAPEIARERGTLVIDTARSQRHPDALGAWTLARLCAVLGRPRKALVHIEEALARGLSGGHPDADLPVLELKARLLEPEDPEQAAVTLLALARDLDVLARHGDAVSVLDRAVALDPGNIEAWWYAADSRRLAARRLAWPYADSQEIARGLRDWQRGTELGHPGPKHAWVHLSGALLIEAHARDGDDRGDWIWSAALQAEQAIALEPDAADAWALAARFHRMLGHPVTARLAVDAAVARQPDNGPALVEQLEVHLAADSPELDGIMERARVLPESQIWAMIASATRSLAHGRAREARHAFAAAIAIEPESAGLHVGRGIAAALAGDEEQATGETADLSPWSRSPAEWTHSPELHEQRGLAALVRGDGDEAVAAFTRVAGSHRVDQAKLCGRLAAAELLRGHTHAALEHLDELAERARVAMHVLDARRLAELAALRLGRELDDDVALRLAAVAKRVDELPGGVAGAELELEAAAAGGGVRYVVAVAARARTLAEAGELDRAAALYERLLAHDDVHSGLPAAWQALIRVLRAASDAAAQAGDAARVRAVQERLAGLGAGDPVEAALAIADAELQAGRAGAAIEELERLLEAPAEPAEGLAGAERGAGAISPHRLHPARLRHGDLLLRAGRHDGARTAYDAALACVRDDAGAGYEVAETHARLGVLAAARGDLAGAAGALREALSNPTPTPDAQAVEQVMTSCREATDGGREPSGLATVMRVLTEDRALPEPLRRELRAARFAAIRAATRRTSLAPQAAIVIEFDVDAFPHGGASAEASHLLGTALPAMRDELKAATGVRTPRVVVRTSELLGSGCYRLLVRGVPYAGGRHAPGRFLCVDPAAPDELASEEPPLASIWDGTRGYWLTGSALGDARRRGLRLLEPLDAVVWHLRGLVRVHLPSLVGLTDVRHALGVLLAEGHQDGIDIAGVMGDVGRQVQLASVVRQLVREQVGVGDLATIVAAIEEASAGEDVLACVDRARAALPLALPGAEGGRARLTLAPELEAAIAAADPAVEHPRLCLACSELVAGRAPGSFVISVQERERRRAVQSAFDRLLPTVAVAAARDLPAARVQRRRGRQRATVETGA